MDIGGLQIRRPQFHSRGPKFGLWESRLWGLGSWGLRLRVKSPKGVEGFTRPITDCSGLVKFYRYLLSFFVVAPDACDLHFARKIQALHESRCVVVKNRAPKSTCKLVGYRVSITKSQIRPESPSAQT